MSLNPLRVEDLISERLPEERHAITIESYIIENHRGSQGRLMQKLMLIMARRIKALQHDNTQTVDASLVTA